MAINVGLDIGSSAVRAAAVDVGRPRPVLRRYGEMPVPAGAVVAGEIMDESAVVEALAALWRRYRFPKRRVVVGAANQRVVVRRVVLPLMDDQELAESLPFQVQDAIPLPVEDALLDYIPLAEAAEDVADNEQAVLVVAAHRDMVSQLVAVTREAGLTLQAVDLKAFALLRAALSGELVDTETPTAVVDIGATTTQVVVARSGVARFVRILPRGGDEFTATLVDHMGMSAEEAEEAKRRVGVTAGGERPEGQDVQTQALLTQEADSFIDEIRGSFTYYRNQSGDPPIEHLVVAGHGARLPHLANRLGDQVGSTPEPARVLDIVQVGRVKISQAELEEAQPVLPTAVGLALWSGR